MRIRRCLLYTSDLDKRWVLFAVCAGAVIVLARYYLYLTLQATERVKEYAIIVIRCV